jgi:hypothetical protein
VAHTAALIGDLLHDRFRFAEKAHGGGAAAGVPADIVQRFLRDTKYR